MRALDVAPAMPAAARAPVTYGSVARARAERLAYLDALKVGMVAAIIAGHGVMGYSDLDSAWPYQSVQEVALPELANIVLALVVLPAALFTMGLFFLISGLLTPASVERKGPRRFARDRALRLGVPLVVWVLAIWPTLVWAAHLAAGEDRSWWEQFKLADPLLDTGPMWFVGVLLIYSLGYAALRARVRPLTAPALTGRMLVRIAIAVSLATMLVRIAFPLASGQPAHPNLWQWPQYLALFGLGVMAAPRGWLQPVPEALARACGKAALAGIAGFLLLGVALLATGSDGDVLFEEHLHWAPMWLAALEGPLAIGTSVWLVAVAQRRCGTPFGKLGRAFARSAFAAFILQGAVLIGLQIALRPLGAPATVKALVVAVAGTAGSFALAWWLVTKTRVARVL